MEKNKRLALIFGKTLSLCLILLILAIFVTSCEQMDNTLASVIEVTSDSGITSIEHDSEHDNTLQLTATVTFSGSSPEFLYWSSSNENIAKVNQKGEVYMPTGNYLYGYVEIIASSIDGGYGSIEIFVTPPGGYVKNDDGTSWKIYTAEGLLAWNEYVMTNSGTEEAPIYNNLSTNAKLMADITLPDPTEGQSNWTPIGSFSSENGYSGIFDGNGKTIFNMTIIESEESKLIGLFDTVAVEGVIQNVTLEDVNLQSVSYTGCIAGYNNGTIIECRSDGNVKVKGNYAGGIVGCNWGTIYGCFSTCNVEEIDGEKGSGGIAGYSGGNVLGCGVRCNVTASNKSGGIVGYCYYPGGIVGCYSMGNVEVSSENGFAGGIVGETLSTIVGCYSISDVKSFGDDAGAGGIVGSLKKPSSTVSPVSVWPISECYWDGMITLNNNVVDSGIGKNERNEISIDKVTTWSDVTSAMNTAIAEWNRNNDDKCIYHFVQEDGADEPPVLKAGEPV